MISYLKRLINKFANAFSGIAYGLKHDRSIGFQCLIGAVVLLFGGLYGFTLSEWLFILLLICLVIAAEFFNSAIEKCVDLISPQYNELAKIIKDYGAAAVLVVSLAALLVGLLILKGALR